MKGHICQSRLIHKATILAQSNFMWINPLSPDIKMHILLTALHTFLMELVRRICLNIKTSYSW